ncbi:MAG: YceI family protein [Hyphomicrobiaceae bacterium]
MRARLLVSWWLSFVAIMVFGALAASQCAVAETYHFKGGHSTVTIGWSHAGLSHHTARIVGIVGSLEFDPASPEMGQVDVRLDPADLSSGVPALDRLLRSPDFFDVSSYPAITFKSTQVMVTGERSGQVSGDLTIRGTTRPVTLNVTWNFSGEHPLGLVNPSFAGKFVSGFSATTKLLRSEWGLGRGAPLISDEIDVAIEVEAVRR